MENIKKKVDENSLILIPKTERYMEYMLDLIIKLPRMEKYSIGVEFKSSMYRMLEEILLFSKIDKSIEKNVGINVANGVNKNAIYILNSIDSKLNT